MYAGQEATVRTGHGTTDWFQIGKGVCQGCILSPCLFNLYAEYIKRNAGLEEAQAGIRIAGRNINNLRYADDTTLMPCMCNNSLQLELKRVKRLIWFRVTYTVEWVAISCCRGSSQPRNPIQASPIAGRLFTIYITFH